MENDSKEEKKNWRLDVLSDAKVGDDWRRLERILHVWDWVLSVWFNLGIPRDLVSGSEDAPMRKVRILYEP